MSWPNSAAALADDERQRIEETLSRSREIAAGESREAFNEAIFDMQGVTKVLTRVMLARAGAGGRRRELGIGDCRLKIGD